MKPGVRVIRGPDWQSKNQDGGEGHVGSIVYVPKEGSSDDRVTVIWDSGRELRYRAGKDGKYDLRMLDNSQIGVQHETIVCDVCSENPVIGIRWKCSVCDDFDLCTRCYMMGKHDISHGFMRMDSYNSQAFGVPPRSFSKSKPVKGVFKGATVMRGPHWKWKNDDGGAGEEGRVNEVINWKGTSPRGGVKIKWKATKKEGEYRNGGEGCVDVIYTEESSGPFNYYFEHLPLVDIVSSGEITLKRSDKVRVNLQERGFQQMQDNKVYGGWNDGMKQCLKELGTIVDMLYGDRTIRLQYGDARIWSVNRQCLTRVHSFSVGEAVRILADVNSVKELQEGHGGWNSDMNSTLGQVGRVVRIGDDGDIRIKIDDRTWIYSPVCVMPVEDLSVAKSVPDLSKSETEVAEEDDLQRMMRDADRMAGALADLFVGLLRAMPDEEDDDMSLVEACAKGDLEALKSIVNKSPEKVNAKHEQKTGLHLACYEGHIEIVKFLLNSKADVHIVDEEGDTALHFAAFGAAEIIIKDNPELINTRMNEGFTALHICAANDHTEIASSLLKAKADKNAVDKNKRAPLHIAVSQSHKQMIELLLTFECDVNLQDDSGNTPLHIAQISRALPDQLAKLLGVPVKNDDTGIQISCLLLEARANIEIENKKGQTPLDLCNDTATKEFMKRLAAQASRKSFQTSSSGIMLPTHWERMAKDVTLKRVHLDTKDGLLNKEYQGVRNGFCKTMPQARIVKIERIQNKFMWEHYYLKRRQFEVTYGMGCANELDLYHGTKPEHVEIISKDNLDHRLAGKNVGTLFGQGTYFARDAKYSDGYSEADEDGHKYMFQCRVLAGKWAQGDPKFKRPPEIEPGNSKSKLYDCCVDNTDTPRIFCLFDCNQYYPEYVIQYK